MIGGPGEEEPMHTMTVVKVNKASVHGRLSNDHVCDRVWVGLVMGHCPWAISRYFSILF
jgi:hypothetical protein